MIYKFKSKASGDVIMLGPNGDQMLRLIGREPAAKGIIEVPDMAAAIAALRAAIDEGAPAESNANGGQDSDAESGEQDKPGVGAVSLRQRLWPVIDLLERSMAAKEPVVWGV